MEHISAMMDGELDETQVVHQLGRLQDRSDLRESWDIFHLIGDAMRGEPPLSDAFDHDVNEKLELEPTVLAPRRISTKRMRTYALSAAASVSAIAVVGWLAFFNNPLAPQQQVATAPTKAPPAVAAVSPPKLSSVPLSSVPSDGTMNEYLMAHQEYSPSTTIQGLAPYIRTVSSAQPASGR